MPRPEFPIVMEYTALTKQVDGEHVRMCLLPEAAAILAARGASQLIFPVPGKAERSLVRDALRFLPPGERDRVVMADQNGRVLAALRSHLQPLKEDVGKFFSGNPAADFPFYAEGFLYELLLAQKYGAAVGDRDLHSLRSLALHVDPTQYVAAGRIRFAEILRVLNAYSPVPSNVGIIADRPTSNIGFDLWRLVRRNDFNEVVKANGAIGYAKHPVVALRHALDVIRDFFGRPEAVGLLKATQAAAEVAGTPQALSAAVVDELAPRETTFTPPLLDISPALRGVANLAMRETIGSPPNTEERLLFERFRGEWVTHAWLDADEDIPMERIIRPYQPTNARAPSQSQRETVAQQCIARSSRLFG